MKNSVLRRFPPELRRNGFFILLTNFILLFTYPFFRASTTTVFLEGFGAQDTPKAWLTSVIVLSLTIYFSNKYQNKLGIHRLFELLVYLSSVLFVLFFFMFQLGLEFFSFPLFVWKEVYIVVILHLLIAYANNYFTPEQVKMFYGPLGGFGSVGAILGGLATSAISSQFGLSGVLLSGACLLLAATLTFHKTLHLKMHGKQNKKVSPIESLGNSKKYVFLIAGLVAFSQVVMTVAELKFNILFEQVVPNSQERTTYLGMVFSSINGVALFIQFLILPWLMLKVKNEKLHYFIPLFYLVMTFIGLGIGAESLIVIAGSFILFKGTDYSLFAVCREYLYQSLGDKQKYGAKYLTDMLSYRSAKALISFLLIFYQSRFFLNTVLYGVLILWFFSLNFLFKAQNQLCQKN